MKRDEAIRRYGMKTVEEVEVNCRSTGVEIKDYPLLMHASKRKNTEAYMSIYVCIVWTILVSFVFPLSSLNGVVGAIFFLIMFGTFSSYISGKKYTPRGVCQ